MIKGFIVGLALTIIIGQVPKLFGIEKGEGDFFEQAWDVLSGLGDTDALTLAVGVASLVVVLGLRRVAPGRPGSLVAVLLGIARRRSCSISTSTSSATSTAGCRRSGCPRTSTTARSRRAASP